MNLSMGTDLKVMDDQLVYRISKIRRWKLTQGLVSERRFISAIHEDEGIGEVCYHSDLDIGSGFRCQRKVMEAPCENCGSDVFLCVDVPAWCNRERERRQSL